MSTADENTDDVLGSVMVPEEDALPNPTRTGHGKMPEVIDDDDYQKAAEQERVAAGLADYAPSDVPPATDPLPPEAAEEADLAQRGLLEEGQQDNG
ncbi:MULTISPECIES: hypothetical protein [unclassified Arthrobacter]|uniref:hypothetical protein n=1 Tax=unclassified Arthrobacter TaxID=235627 RepID=UPI001C859B1C|nr:hypothetical protein [Arthrobacter sp. MAHUQ-56]MBX7443290.1 hypothetical protein [Arthrobacter sp. MAHUQ-56]